MTVQCCFSNIKFSDTCDFVNILDYFAKKHFFNLLHAIITLCDLMTDFFGDQRVTKSRVHCTCFNLVSDKL